MNTKVNNQPILVAVLAVFLAGVLYLAFARDSSPTESGFDSPENLGLVESELVSEPGEGGQASENQRNPFVGPFSSQPGIAEPEPEESVSEIAPESVPETDSE